MNWMLAAILICGASVFTACTSNEDNPAPVPQPDINLAEKIIGKWMVAELDGEPCPTNLKTVVTFDSPTKAFGSLSDFGSRYSLLRRPSLRSPGPYPHNLPSAFPRLSADL